LPIHALEVEPQGCVNPSFASSTICGPEERRRERSNVALKICVIEQVAHTDAHRHVVLAPRISAAEETAESDEDEAKD
jgi:hypothetical protein